MHLTPYETEMAINEIAMLVVDGRNKPDYSSVNWPRLIRKLDGNNSMLTIKRDADYRFYHRVASLEDFTHDWLCNNPYMIAQPYDPK